MTPLWTTSAAILQAAQDPAVPAEQVLHDVGDAAATVDPVRLAPGAMSELIGRRQAHGHGLPREQADAWQRVLDRGARHWSVRFSRPLADGRDWRRNLESLDGDACLARVRALPDGRVELGPTTGNRHCRQAMLSGRWPVE